MFSGYFKMIGLGLLGMTAIILVIALGGWLYGKVTGRLADHSKPQRPKVRKEKKVEKPVTEEFEEELHANSLHAKQNSEHYEGFSFDDDDSDFSF